MRLWRLRSPMIWHLQAGDPGKYNSVRVQRSENSKAVGVNPSLRAREDEMRYPTPIIDAGEKRGVGQFLLTLAFVLKEKTIPRTQYHLCKSIPRDVSPG